VLTPDDRGALADLAPVLRRAMSLDPRSLARIKLTGEAAMVLVRLPFGVLVMFAVMSRFDRAWEEAAYDLGASRWQAMRLIVIPILAPGLVAVALFGFTLSYDEFARTLQTAGSLNTLPLEIWTMTLNVTSPSLYALDTVTTIISFAIIAICLGTIATIQKRRASRAPTG